MATSDLKSLIYHDSHPRTVEVGLAALVGSAQQAGTWGTTQFLLGEDHCIRVTSTTSDQIPLDDSSRIDDLIALGARDALERFDSVERMFLAPGRVRS